MGAGVKGINVTPMDERATAGDIGYMRIRILAATDRHGHTTDYLQYFKELL